ncbi:acyltransferase family protein [Cupriavidus basilensis]|uniref:acyltransferase family protein n=1 Tax=Cupriavidus basilensis TaxID=68895 RepID=UPI0039F6ACCE
MANIDINNPIFGILVIGLCVSLASIACKYSRFYREMATEAGGADRYGQIDGVRGYLALAVFLTHALSAFYWYRTGKWEWPPSVFYTLCGEIPVSVFFMITGYLFWRKAIKLSGRLNLIELYTSRFKRLAPLYLVGAFLVFLLVGVKSGWALQVSRYDLVEQLGSWLALGILPRQDINGVQETWRFNTSLWTLRFEWIFYFSLPFVAVLSTPKKFSILFFSGVFASCVLHKGHPVLVNFLFGMAVAQYLNGSKLAHIFRSGYMSSISICGLILTWLNPTGYGLVQSLLILPLFISLTAGCNFFGIVSSKPARVLGAASYSLYVLHCVILQAVLLAVNSITPVGEMKALPYWGLMACVAGVIVFTSLITFRWVEHPFMGKPVGRIAGVPA